LTGYLSVLGIQLVEPVLAARDTVLNEASV